MHCAANTTVCIERSVESLTDAVPKRGVEVQSTAKSVVHAYCCVQCLGLYTTLSCTVGSSVLFEQNSTAPLNFPQKRIIMMYFEYMYT